MAFTPVIFFTPKKKNWGWGVRGGKMDNKRVGEWTIILFFFVGGGVAGQNLHIVTNYTTYINYQFFFATFWMLQLTSRE